MKQIADLGPLLTATIKAYGEGSDRSMQSAEGRIGPSDVGFCRMKAVLMVRGIDQSDSTPIAAAQIGTAIHAYVAQAMQAFFPDWIADEQRVTATLPSGAEVSGTPDLIISEYNAVLDWKTVDGFEWVKRNGVSQNHRFQRHLYALGAIQAGLLDDSEPVFVINGYIDRSGKETEPYFVIDEYDPTLTDEIDAWIGDVQYAVLHKEDGSRDIPAPVCEKICSYFSVCRGALPVNEGGEFIEDEQRKEALRMYIEARDTEKTAGKQKREAQAILHGTNGVADIDGQPYQIRWTHINGGIVESFEKQSYDRMDVRKVRK